MTITELLKKEPHLRVAKDGEHIYLIPYGMFGYTSYPTGTVDDNGIFIPNERAVEVLPDQYLALKERKYCWNNNTLIPYIKPVEIAEAEETVAAYQTLDVQETEARAYLEKYDYISSKVANAILLDDSSLLAQYREKYKDVLVKLTEARNTVNRITEQRAHLKEAYEAAQQLLSTQH